MLYAQIKKQECKNNVFCKQEKTETNEKKVEISFCSVYLITNFGTRKNNIFYRIINYNLNIQL